MSLSQELENRGFIHQIAGPSLSEIVDGKKRVIFQGIDPSADSAHAGNMVIWMLLRHLAENGHKVIFLVGGGTGMIGDPKPDAERQLNDEESVAANVSKLTAQAKNFFAGLEVEFVNNADWLKELKLIDFLRDTGKHFTVNELIKKDAIATRLASDTGLSYTEFAYPLLQGYDYYQLHQQKNCTVQIGGSDQWGNMVAGVELIRRKSQTEVSVITVPLIVDKATGKKFGKSEGNAVWLSAEKTSPYQFYQFWLNSSDENIADHLKLFTFLSLESIDKIVRNHEVDPSARTAQKTLAFEVTKVVHGEEGATTAGRVSEALFGGGDMSSLSEDEKEILLENAPVFEVEDDIQVVNLLVETGLASSKREARTFVEGGGVSFLGEKVTDLDQTISLMSGDICPLRRGKKSFVILYKK